MAEPTRIPENAFKPRTYDRDEVEFMMKRLVMHLFESELRDVEMERWQDYYTPLQTDGRGNFWCDELQSPKLTQLIDDIVDTIDLVQDWNQIDPPK